MLVLIRLCPAPVYGTWPFSTSERAPVPRQGFSASNDSDWLRCWGKCRLTFAISANVMSSHIFSTTTSRCLAGNRRTTRRTNHLESSGSTGFRLDQTASVCALSRRVGCRRCRMVRASLYATRAKYGHGRRADASAAGLSVTRAMAACIASSASCRLRVITSG